MNTQELVQLALDYGFDFAGPLDVTGLEVLQDVRDACAKNTCGQYGASWACPPAFGDLEESRKIIARYKSGIIVQSMQELEDSFDFEGIAELGQRHGKNFKKLMKRLREDYPGLMALGETSCTGLHGANRLASNSLLEAVVYAHRAAQKLPDLLAELRRLPDPGRVEPWQTGGAAQLDEGVLVNHNWDDIRRLMWDYVGIVRSRKRLVLMRERLDLLLREITAHFGDYLLTPDLVELRNLAVVAELITRSATWREESRGLHYILDYPHKDDARFRRDSVLCKTNEMARA